MLHAVNLDVWFHSVGLVDVSQDKVQTPEISVQYWVFKDSILVSSSSNRKRFAVGWRGNEASSQDKMHLNCFLIGLVFFNLPH